MDFITFELSFISVCKDIIIQSEIMKWHDITVPQNAASEGQRVVITYIESECFKHKDYCHRISKSIFYVSDFQIRQLTTNSIHLSSFTIMIHQKSWFLVYVSGVSDECVNFEYVKMWHVIDVHVIRYSAMQNASKVK